MVKFYSPQLDRLEAVLDEYMLWHKANMLGRYQREMDQTVARIEKVFQKENSQPLSDKEVYQFIVMTRTLYWDSAMPLAEKVAPLLAELGPEQVDRTRTLINRKIDERKETLELKSTEYQKEVEETWADNLEEWFGELTETQRAELKKASPGLMTSPKARFARSVLRMKNFLGIFEEIPLKKKDERTAQLKLYFKEWQQTDLYKNWRQNVSVYMANLINGLTENQREHFLKKLKKWQKTLQDLKND